MACHHGDSEEGTAEGMRIASSAVFSRLVLRMLKEVSAPYPCWAACQYGLPLAAKDFLLLAA